MAINRLNVSLSGVQPGGLAKVVPSSVAVGSGSGSADSNGTVSFSGASSISLNSIFSATYNNYLIKLHLTACTGDGQVWIKLRNGTTDKSANYTTSSDTINSSATRNTFTNNSTSGFMLGETDASSSNSYYSWTVQLHTPFPSSVTTGQVQGAWYSATGEYRSNYGGVMHNENYSADGITVIAGAGNITGIISVYGYA